MSYPKRCEKCDQFGAWCFCVFPVEPDFGPIYILWSVIYNTYCAEYGKYRLRLHYTARTVAIIHKLCEEASSRADGAGRHFVVYTREKWNDLVKMGEFV